MIFLFDSTIDGLFSAIYESYYFKEPECIYSEKSYQCSLFEQVKIIETTKLKSDKVRNAILEKLSEDNMSYILNCFLSEDKEAPYVIYRYLKKAFKKGGQIIDDLSDKDVLALRDIAKKVSRENHLLVGLLRFKKLKNGIYYASFEPTYDQIPILAAHFANRLGDQYWIIHDKKRKYGAFYDMEQWYLREINIDKEFEYDDEEIFIQKLWSEYFNRIAIEERKSEKRQMNMMPKKYWKYLVEMR